MRIDNEIKLDFKDVLIRPKRSTLKSRSEVDLTRTYVFRHSKREWTGVPIIASNMDSTGTFEVARVLAAQKCLTTCHKFYDAEDWVAFAAANPSALPFLAASSGSSTSDLDALEKILVAVPGLTMICLDVANGYSEHFVTCVKNARERFPHHTIIAGNVVTGEMVEELILTGADIVKVGIGPGSVCTTRKQTGVGYPQLSAIIECADAAHGLGGLIIGDGGITCPGDVAKALGAGADFVMCGGVFAGHDESGGELIVRDGVKYKAFYGMSSSVAMRKYAGGVAEYRSSEGKAVEVPYRGRIEATLLDILGGLRSACTYVGAGHLKELSKRTTFIRVTAQLNEVFTPFNAKQEHGYSRLQSSIVGAVRSASPADSGTPIGGAAEAAESSVSVAALASSLASTAV